jgi:hypothetical protein
MENKTKPELRKEAQQPVADQNHNSLDEAVKAVYREYGTDLSAFFRDAYREAAREHSVDEKVEACR